MRSYRLCRQRRGNGAACPGNGRAWEKCAGKVVAGENLLWSRRNARGWASQHGYSLVGVDGAQVVCSLSSDQNGDSYALYAEPGKHFSCRRRR